VTTPRPLTRAELADLAERLRELLVQVEEGTLAASTAMRYRLEGAVAALDAAPDADLAGVVGKEARWEEIQASEAFSHQRFVADAWCAAFVWPKPEIESASGGKQKLANPIVEAAPTNALWLP